MSRTDRLLSDLLRTRAALTGDHEVLISQGGILTYDTWHRRSTAAAHGLIAAGVEPGDRIGVLLGEAEWDSYLISLLALHKAGATAVPVSISWATESAARIFRTVGVRTVIAGSEVAPEGSVDVLNLADLTRRPGNDFQTPINAEAVAEIIWTSGSTGAPRPVCVSHASLTAGIGDDLSGELAQGPLAVTPGRFVAFTPLGTSAAGKQVMQLLTSSLTTFVALPFFEPANFVASVLDNGAHRVALVPATARALHRSGQVPVGGLESVRTVSLSSAPLTAPVVRAVAEMFPLATIFDLYGSSEAGRVRLYRRRTIVEEVMPFRPLPPCAVRVVDESGGVLAAGELGHIEVWDPSPSRWYDDEPGGAADVFRPDGWVRTGDLGVSTADGGMILRGRADDVIVAGGINVSPGEIEDAILAYPGVSDVSVVGVTHDVLGVAVAAALVMEPGEELNLGDFRAFGLRVLGRTRAPRRVIVIDELPRLPSLKIDRPAVVRLFEGASQLQEHPADDLHGASLEMRAVLGAARSVLEVPTLSADDDLFQAGLDSLAALELSVRLSSELGLELDPWACFDLPTARLLAEYAAQERTTGSSEIA